MTVKDIVRTRAEPQTPYASRARYHTSENPFTFGYPPVSVRQFLAQTVSKPAKNLRARQ
jgi:hypothetical protein